MTSAFSWQKSYQPSPCFILYSKAKFTYYSRCFLTSYFCIPVPWCQFQKVLQVFIELFNFSLFSITGWVTWITMILNGLPWKRTEITLSFLRLHPSSSFWQWHPTPVLLSGKSHGRRSLVGCSPWDREESDMTEQFHFHFSLLYIGEGNGNPLQCSCLENPRDGVAQSWTRLK